MGVYYANLCTFVYVRKIPLLGGESFKRKKKEVQNLRAKRVYMKSHLEPLFFKEGVSKAPQS